MIFLKFIIDIFWIIAIIFLLGGALYYSYILKFPQLRLLMIVKSFKNASGRGISAFKSLSMSLAARIGVGSLSGIALAIYIGGPGTIFWIWIVGIITSINVFVESYLGAKYQEIDGDLYKGGPAFYISRGLKLKKLGKFYALIIIVAYIVGFMSIQANTITVSINKYFGVNSTFIAIVLCTITIFSIMKGLNRISSITSKLVPLMGTVYIFLSLFIIINNIDKIPQTFILILKDAFNFKAIGGAFLSNLVIGIQRGVFATESGLGTGSIASSCTCSKDKISLGLVQILGIYFTIFIICTATAMLILTSDYSMLSFGNINGIELTQYALFYHLGDFGIIILIFSVISFAYSTIVAGYYYGESNLKFLKSKNNESYIVFLKIITIVLLFIGSIISPDILWNIVDILVALLGIINMYSLLKFSKEVKSDYINHKNIV